MSNSPSPEPPDSGNDILRRLNALKQPSGASAPPPTSSISSPNSADDLPNLSAQKLLVMQARLLSRQVNAEKTATVRHQFIEDELDTLKDRVVSKDLLLAVAGTQRDDIAKVREQVETMRRQQQETSDLIVKVAVALGMMILGLTGVIGLLMGGRP